MGKKIPKLALLYYLPIAMAFGQNNIPFHSKPLQEQGDLSVLMVEGIDRFLEKETDRVRDARPDFWQRDFSSEQAFHQSIQPQREILARQLGVVDNRKKINMEVLTDSLLNPLAIQTEGWVVRAVRWEVIPGKYQGLSAEGLLLQPKGRILARVVLVPDADILPEVYAGLQDPEAVGFGLASRLAGAGVEVLIPVLVSREDRFSGDPLRDRFTNQPHREWIYRQGFILGRHIIGYELQKIFSAIDWLEAKSREAGHQVPIGVVGYGEGGLLALHAAALDNRVLSTLVSGYFDAREKVWEEPIYRNVFGSLKFFGDAELAVMAWPRNLIIEHARGPEVTGPPAPSRGRSGAAPGNLTTPATSSAKAEWDRAVDMVPADQNHLFWYADGDSPYPQAFSEATLKVFAKSLKIELSPLIQDVTAAPLDHWLDALDRQERTVRNMEYQMQRVLALSEKTRERQFWQTLQGGVEEQQQVKENHRERLWEVLGRLPDPSVPANPRARLVMETEKWTAYDVVLDVWPEVFAWGILLVPKDRQAGERLPTVVCQHGLEGLPEDLINKDTTSRTFATYKAFAASLAERRYVVFAPFNPYKGEDSFRVLQRKANPLGLSLFSVITGQHQRIVEWLGQQPFVDPRRIGFYGLSYGGKTAMRVPPLVKGYALSICSGDFNEWIRKVASTDVDGYNSYPFTPEYEMPEWDLAHTYGYAEMAALIAPRPFMVERGHLDGVGTDEWVAYEFAKVRRHYDFLGLPDARRIEYFNGPHTIHGVGTFEFLDRQLKNR